MKNVFITGASGFIGKHICKYLNGNKINIFAMYRDKKKINYNYKNYIFEISPKSEWLEFPNNIDTVIHTAELAHSNFNSEEYEKIYFGIIKFFENLKIMGVKKFIYLSSSKLYSNDTDGKLLENSKLIINSNYTKYKHLTEKYLIKNAGTMDIVILRLPLVYGPGVKSNFLSLIRYLDLSITLIPISHRNLRSYLYIHNLNDLIIRIINSNKIISGIYNVSDNQDISFQDLCIHIATELRSKYIKIKFNKFLINFFSKIINQRNIYNIIFEEKRMNISKLVSVFDWTPKYKLEEGIKATIEYYQKK